MRRKLFLRIAAIALIPIAAVAIDFLRLGSELTGAAHGSSQRILDRYGREIRHALGLHGERRYLIPLEEIPESLRRAFIQAEDRRFYEHHGVDWRALARGLWQSLRHLRAISGGSTITMQLVRTQWGTLHGLAHKPAQILQALRIEKRYSKGEILTQYLNTVPFGSQISGVGAACRYFFDRACGELSPAQTATLAVIPRNPAVLVRNLPLLRKKRNLLLARLVPPSEPLVLDQAIAEPLELARAVPDFFAPHLAEVILREKPGVAEIHSTLDLDLQRSVRELLGAEAARTPGTGDSGAVLILENMTGEVLAYVGSPDYFDPTHGMVDGVRAARSPGSALKPFVYELALENGWDLFSTVPDIPMVFATRRSVYEPSNYGGNYSGPRTIRDALGNSKNLPALFMTDKLGEARVLEHLRRLGFSTLSREASFYGVGIALGNGEVDLWDLTRAYSTLARLGIDIAPSIYRGERPRPQRLIPAETAFLIADVLRDPDARREEFGRFGPLVFDYEVAAKTGTSTDYRDHWTVGFTRNVSVGLWRGNADSSPMRRRVSASRGAGALFHRIVDLAHQYRTPRWVTPPEGIRSSRICPLSGQLPGKNCPLTRSEYHLADRAPTTPCKLHKSVTVPECHGKTETLTYVELPEMYTEWAKHPRFPSLENQLAERCGRLPGSLRTGPGDVPIIVEPLDQATYAIDPTIPLDHQEIRFALRNIEATRNPRLYVNGEPAGEPLGGSEVFWPIRAGRFAFFVDIEGKRSNVVNVQVR